MRRPTLLVTLLILAATAAPALAAGVKTNPENDRRRGPAMDAGYFLGSPTPTYQWHGCTKVDTHYWPIPLAGPSSPSGKSTSRYVRFTVKVGGGFPRFAWKAKPGWRICGVQAAAQLRSRSVRADLLAEIGYPSGPTQGSTSAASGGTETLSVTIPKRGIRARGFEQFEGQTFSIVAFQSVSVFVKRKG
jgi:hypothetical protein